MIKSIFFIFSLCGVAFFMPLSAGHADRECMDDCSGQPCGPCVCYCPMVKYVPKYHCETKCHTEPYQVAKKCCRYTNQYYTKTYCRQVPEYYYTYETKYRKRYTTENKCTYVAKKYVEKKCVSCPTPAVAAPCGDTYSTPCMDSCNSGCGHRDYGMSGRNDRGSFGRYEGNSSQRRHHSRNNYANSSCASGNCSTY